jgi:hypothetical protein
VLGYEEQKQAGVASEDESGDQDEDPNEAQYEALRVVQGWPNEVEARAEAAPQRIRGACDGTGVAAGTMVQGAERVVARVTHLLAERVVARVAHLLAQHSQNGYGCGQLHLKPNDDARGLRTDGRWVLSSCPKCNDIKKMNKREEDGELNRVIFSKLTWILSRRRCQRCWKALSRSVGRVVLC